MSESNCTDCPHWQTASNDPYELQRANLTHSPLVLRPAPPHYVARQEALEALCPMVPAPQTRGRWMRHGDRRRMAFVPRSIAPPLSEWLDRAAERHGLSHWASLRLLKRSVLQTEDSLGQADTQAERARR